MEKTATKVNTIDTLNWPERCPQCGQSLKEGNVMRFELKIKKGLKGLFATGFRAKIFLGDTLWSLREEALEFSPNDRKYRRYGHVRGNYGTCYF